MKRIFLPPSLALWASFVLIAVLLASCAPVDLNAPMPTFETGVDPNAWAQVPAGEFYFGQFDHMRYHFQPHVNELSVLNRSYDQLTQPIGNPFPLFTKIFKK